MNVNYHKIADRIFYVLSEVLASGTKNLFFI